MQNKINKYSKIFVAGHKGLVGSAVLRRLKYFGYKNILTISREKLDLRDQNKVKKFFKKHKPHAVINAAATVGGIYANNKYRAEFIYENLMIQTNLINTAYLCGIKDLIFLGSSCVYPRNCKQPIKEEYLLSGQLEKTNEPYAIAKIAGIKMCESYNSQYNLNYKCLMPTNTYGPNDNYDKLNSHFFASLIRKVHQTKKSKKKEIIIWGDGTPRREMIYVDDLADACVYFMNKRTKETLINVGTGKDFSIKYYTKLILSIINPDQKVKIKYDKSKPNGTIQKKLDISVLKKYSWRPKINLIDGIKLAYVDFLARKLAQ